MDESVFQQPTQEQLDLFVHGDSIAMYEVVELVLPQIYSWGKRHYPHLQEEDIYSVIDDVISETCDKYSRYNPKRAKFTTYVIDLIIKRMKTLQRQQIKLAEQEDSIENYSENPSIAMYNSLEADMARRIDRENFFIRVHHQLSELEAAFLDLMLSGEIHQEPFIEVLKRYGISTKLSREVNNTKERTKYKLEMFAKTQGLSLEDFL
jgi:hypothetical protein